MSSLTPFIRRGLPPVVLAFLRHLIFLKPAQAGCGLLPQGFDSIDQSSSVPYRAKENRQARRAMSPRSSTGTGSRKNIVQVPPPWASFLPRSFQQWPNLFELLLADITWIMLPFHPISVSTLSV
jgi:hypothetical protein